MKYRKKPVIIDAFQYGVDSNPDWFIYKISIGEIIPYAEEGCSIKTLEGVMKGYHGDMIIKGIQGEIYPCKKDIFDATYEKIE